MLPRVLLMTQLMLAPVPVLRDSGQLQIAAQLAQVPVTIAWALAWEETRTGAQGNRYLGPDTNTSHHHICRAVGRLQLNPCGNWRSVVHEARCTLRRVQQRYTDNVYCGLRYLRRLYEHTGSWLLSVRMYNGSGQEAEAFAFRVWRHIEEAAHTAPSVPAPTAPVPQEIPEALRATIIGPR